MTPDQLKLLADSEFDRGVHKKNLKETAQAQLMVPLAGGLFMADTTLIAFLASWTEDIVYLKDVYENPIKVNRQELLDKLKTAYASAMQTWYDEQERSNRIRRAANV